MPKTLTEVWTETEVSRGSGDELQLTRYWYEYRRRKLITVARVNLEKRAAIRQTRQVPQKETWSCPYCKRHSTSREKIRADRADAATDGGVLSFVAIFAAVRL